MATTALAATLLLVAGACTGSRSTSDTSGGPSPSSTAPPTTEAPQALIGWNDTPLVPPFEADGGALVVVAGDPPADVTEAQALDLAHGVVGGASTRAAREPVSGTVTVSLPPSQVGPGVAAITGRPAWIVAYRTPVSFGCPVITPTSIPPTASNLDAIIITGAGQGQVAIYHGAGTGPCQPRVQPIISAPTHL